MWASNLMALHPHGQFHSSGMCLLKFCFLFIATLDVGNYSIVWREACLRSPFHILWFSLLWAHFSKGVELQNPNVSKKQKTPPIWKSASDFQKAPFPKKVKKGPLHEDAGIYIFAYHVIGWYYIGWLHRNRRTKNKMETHKLDICSRPPSWPLGLLLWLQTFCLSAPQQPFF